MDESVGLPPREPPEPPRSAYGLLTEMFGVLDSSPGLYQGMMRYWMMWRFPQIVECIKNAPPLRFHFCGTYEALRSNFLRLFLLPDFLVVGQCGPVLAFEVLQYEHPFGQQWPNVDGQAPGLGVLSAKLDRPFVDGVVGFAKEWLQPLAPANRLLLAPFSTLIGPPIPPWSTEHSQEIVDAAANQATDSGRPDKELSQRMREALVNSEEETVEMKAVEGVSDSNLGEWEHAFGRFSPPGFPIAQPDPFWDPSAILAFEFMMAQQLGATLIVGGEWSQLIPTPRHELKVRVPYVEGLSPQRLMDAIQTDGEAFAQFRGTLTHALLEAMDRRGSPDFERELRHIQHDIIDEGIRRLNRTWEALKKDRRLRIGGHVTKVLTTTVGLYMGFEAAALAGLIGGGILSGLSEYRERGKERQSLRSEPMYFIWRLGH